jgi:hypothetical protein
MAFAGFGLAHIFEKPKPGAQDIAFQLFVARNKIVLTHHVEA